MLDQDVKIYVDLFGNLHVGDTVITQADLHALYKSKNFILDCKNLEESYRNEGRRWK